jgi:peptidyl-prolyl cis-trans isomerase B (cyclophilin B)
MRGPAWIVLQYYGSTPPAARAKRLPWWASEQLGPIQEVIKVKRKFPSVCTSLVVLLVCSVTLGQAPDFKEGTRDPYRDPPAKSRNGKSMAEMKAKVQAEWPELVFEKDGKPVQYQVTLQTDAGDIVIEFFPDVAPNHVRSFLALSKVGFFDGLIFHRVIPGFVIQGGCPIGDGTGGPGYCLKPEFSNKKHVRGILSMARAQPLDSAGSQFFVCVADTPPLDNKYTVFGQVTQGMDVVDKIVNAERNINDRPLEPVTIKKAVVEVK